MVRTDTVIDPFAELATGVAQLDAGLCIRTINSAFAEHTGMGASRLAGRSLAALQPDGARLHALAEAARASGHANTLRGATVCAAPGHDARLDFTCTPVATGVLVETHPAAAAPRDNHVSKSLRGFAHEIRNPLAAISGAAQLLEQGAHDTRQRELAELVRAEAERLAALSERLLGARRAMATRSVNVHAVLGRVADLLAAEHAAVNVVRDYDPSLPAWQGDPDRLLQALLNLARNAIEAHAQSIILRSRAESGWRNARGHAVAALRIEVEDDGDGVPAALAATLFEPMVSGHAGTGLGLALAREIAREHGGELSYQPRGRGSRFVLQLPRHARAAEPTP